MIRILGSILSIAFLASCATPTKTSMSQERAFDAAGALKPVEITKETVVIDARPAFDYSTGHIPRSVPMNWSDFTEPEPAQRGIIQHDTFGAARRLARSGITPASKVVVVGRGRAGGGEEGRVAWMLAYLGVPNVQFAALETLKPRLTNTPEANATESAAIWKPELNEGLNATKEEFLFVINSRGVDKAIAFAGRAPTRYKLIDVRSEKAYLGSEGLALTKRVPNMDAINIPWTQFFTADFRANLATLEKLKAMGWGAGDRMIVLDDNGVASAAVVMVLKSYGFKDVANYSGGLQDLIP